MPATQLSNISTILTEDILPRLESQIEAPSGAYELIQTLPRDLTDKTGAVSVPLNRNTYAVNTLAEDSTIATEAKSITKTTVTPIRRYAAAEITGAALAQAPIATVQSTFSNLISSLFKDLQQLAYTTLSGISGIDSYGTDNIAINRTALENLDMAFYNDELGDLSDGQKVLVMTPRSVNDVKAISDFTEKFSYTGELTRSMLGEIFGIPIVTTPQSYLPSGAAGKINMCIWPQAFMRVFQDDAPDKSWGNYDINQDAMEFNYRGCRMYVWVYAIDNKLKNYVMAVTCRSGILPINNDGVKLLLGR